MMAKFQNNVLPIPVYKLSYSKVNMGYYDNGILSKLQKKTSFYIENEKYTKLFS